MHTSCFSTTARSIIGQVTFTTKTVKTLLSREVRARQDFLDLIYHNLVGPGGLQGSLRLVDRANIRLETDLRGNCGTSLAALRHHSNRRLVCKWEAIKIGSQANILTLFFYIPRRECQRSPVSVSHHFYRTSLWFHARIILPNISYSGCTKVDFYINLCWSRFLICSPYFKSHASNDGSCHGLDST